MGRPAENPDRRARRTREAIVRAFVRLVFERRYEAITIADLAAAAGVGRATLYEHFHGKSDVLLAAMEPILLPLANAATGRGSRACVRAMLDHVWQQRATGRVVLGPIAASRLQRRLAAMIEARMQAQASSGVPATMTATAAAAAQLAMLRMWIAGEAACPADVLAQRMIRCSGFVRP